MSSNISLPASLFLFRAPLFGALPSEENHRDHEDLQSLFLALNEFRWLDAANVSQSIRYRSFAHIDDLFENESNRRVSLNNDLAFLSFSRGMVEGFAAQNLSDEDLETAITESGLELESAERLRDLVRSQEYRDTYFELQTSKLQLSFANSSPYWRIKQTTLSVYASILARAAVYSELLADVPIPDGATPSVADLVETERTRNYKFLTNAKAALAIYDLEKLQSVSSEFRRSILRNIDRYANLICLCEKIWNESLAGTISDQKEAHTMMLSFSVALRESLSFLCLSVRFSQIASFPIWAEEVKEWALAAQTLGMESVAIDEDGLNVTHGQLEANWADYEGKLVEISGVISDLRTLNETDANGEKTTSFFNCTEISTDQDQIEIAVPYSNLPGQGVTDGSPCRLSGVTYLGGDGNRRIRLDTHRFSDYRKESFYDFCQAEIGDLFPLWFLRKNIEMGFLTGKDDRLGTGAKEVGIILVGNYE